MNPQSKESAKRSGDLCEKFGYKFKWTDQHISQERMSVLRFEYDQLGSRALERLQKLRDAQVKDPDSSDATAPNRSRKDLYTILKDNHEDDDVLAQFWKETHDVPEWVDWAQLARGQEFFHRYIGANLTGFALQGFIGENSASHVSFSDSPDPWLTIKSSYRQLAANMCRHKASAGTAEILVRTGGFSTRVLLHRLFETTQWLLQVLDSIDSIQPGGAGHIATIRVRLLHASVRQRVNQLTASRPGYYDLDRYGIPVNTLDSIHATSIFCASPLWQQLPRQGIFPRKDEEADYIALFRYLGYLLSTPPEFFVSSSQAKATMESLVYYELNPSAAGKVLGFNFVECLRDVSPMNISRGFIEAGARWVNGDEVCDAMGMGKPGIYYSALVVGQCMLNLALCWAQRAVPALDRWVITTSRTGLKEFVIHGDILKRPSTFDFKHIPTDGKKTEAERGIEAPSVQKIDRWIERYFFFAFVAGCLLISGGIYMLGEVVMVTGAKAGHVLTASFVEEI
ncbi:MAG: hypothetical protein Q9195_009226 [Heterodermia aff. obscurata]